MFSIEAFASVLKAVGLTKTVAALPSGLNTVIVTDESGEAPDEEPICIESGGQTALRQLSGRSGIDNNK